MTTPFFRLLSEEDKETGLRSAIGAYRNGEPAGGAFFEVDPESFRKVPNSPFAYWVDDSIRDLFRTLPPFESEGRTVKQGLATADDFRFVRAWWEVPAERRLDAANGPDWREDLPAFQDWCRKRTREGKYWVPFAKGGEYSPYYADIHLVVNWKDEGEELDAFSGSVIRNPGYYFRPGLTWSRRSNKGLTFRTLNAGCVFSDKGPVVFANNPDFFLAVINSSLFLYLVNLQMAFGSYEVGVIGRTPVVDKEGSGLSELARKCISLRRSQYADDETNREFHSSIFDFGGSLAFLEIAKRQQEDRDISISQLNEVMASIDEQILQYISIDSSVLRMLPLKSFVDALGMNSESELEENAKKESGSAFVISLVHWIFGVAAGRWDVRSAHQIELVLDAPDPFEPLPICPPAMLIGRNRLPAWEGEIQSEDWLRAGLYSASFSQTAEQHTTIPDSEYPLTIPWNGILVDNPDHPDDIVQRVRKALEVLWKEKAFSVEHEACAALGVKDLRDYFRSPSGFYQDHLARYSKSRRKAPIYWPLSTRSGSYTLWLYYPRLNEGTLFECVSRYVDRKLEEVRRELDAVQDRLRKAPTPDLKEKDDELAGFREELDELREEILRVAALPYKPDLDDGVMICAAPLYRLFRLPRWQRELEGCWKKLEKGEYDWAHLAYAVWPERVKEKCRTDRSLAIAHGLEALCTTAPPARKSRAAAVEDEPDAELGIEDEEE